MNRAGGKAGALAAVVAAVAAGCGGSDRLSKSDYEQKLQQEGSQLKTAFEAIDFSDVSNLQEFSTKVTNLQQQIDQSANDLDDLKPPEDADEDNDKIVKALHQFSDKFGEMKQAAKDKDEQRIDQIGQEIDPIGQRIDSATKDLEDKGYDTGEFGNS